MNKKIHSTALLVKSGDLPVLTGTRADHSPVSRQRSVVVTAAEQNTGAGER